LIRSALFVFIAFMVCWFFSDRIYNFLARPVRAALANAQQRQVQLAGETGQITTVALSSLSEGDTGRYVFPETTKLGDSVIPLGTTVAARVGHDSQLQRGLFTDEPLIAGRVVIPKGVRLP